MTRPMIHPGELLAEEFLKPSGVSPHALAHDLKVPRERLDAIIAGDRPVCIDTALRLAHYFGTSDRFWLEQQMTYDLERARRHHSDIRMEVRPLGTNA